MEQRYKMEMKRVFDTHFNIRSFDDRAVFLFGHCNATEEMADYLLKHDVSPAAILDNSTSKQGLAYRKIPILPPEEIQIYTAENSIVLIATRFYAEMEDQLRRLGYEGKIIQVVDYNSFAEYSLSDETFERKTARVNRGMLTLEHIRMLYPTQHLVICPNNALGDVYWAMAFLSAYCANNEIGEVAVAVIGNGCLQVAELFGVENIVRLNHIEMDEFVQAVIFNREDNCIIAHHDRPYTDNIIRWIDKHFLSFIDYYRYAVYGLAKDTLPKSPTNIAPFDNREQISKGNMVILSPYAKSVVELPEEFWEKIADDYLKQGYQVYTNTIGDEASIKGTQSLCIPIAQMIDAVEYGGTFVGIRSGLCDILHTAKCHKTVVFPDCFYSTTPYKVEDFFTLPEWEKIVWHL